jgi:hypothetical protein
VGWKLFCPREEPGSGGGTCLITWKDVLPVTTVRATFARGRCEMAAWVSRLVVAGVLLAAGCPAFADGPNFSDLLARAKAQAAAGHRWAPSGDNMTETVSAMMELISSATPEQLAELSDLLENDAKHLSHPPAGPDQTVEQPAVPPVASEPDRTVERPAEPVKRFELDRPVERPAVSAARSEPDRTVERPTRPAARFELDRAVEAPPAPAATSGPDRSAERPAVSAARSGPDRPVSGVVVPPAPLELDRAVARPALPTTPAEPDRRAPRPSGQAMATEPDRPIPQPPAPVARRPSPRATDLLARGQEAEQLGDVSGARRFYLSAVQLGSATAARKLGRLYDPVFLKRTALGGIDPDLGQARHWYELSIAMGDPDAGPLLEALASR